MNCYKPIALKKTESSARCVAAATSVIFCWKVEMNNLLERIQEVLFSVEWRRNVERWTRSIARIISALQDVSRLLLDDLIKLCDCSVISKADVIILRRCDVIVVVVVMQRLFYLSAFIFLHCLPVADFRRLRSGRGRIKALHKLFAET